MIAVLSKKTKEGGIILHKNYNRVTDIYTDTNEQTRQKHDTARESFQLKYFKYVFSLRKQMFCNCVVYCNSER
jgi:hypothetical protein